MRLPLVFLAALLLAAPAAPLVAQNDQPPPADTNTVLKPGDLVRVTVWRSPEMSGDFPVGINGALVHPLYQDVPIAGIPMSQVTERLRTFLKKYQTDPQIVVMPLLRVTVAGAVEKPSLYNLPRETSVGEAIALAGGPTSEGNLSKVLLFRDAHEYKIDLQSPLQPWASSPIQSGDDIIVGKRSEFWSKVFVPVISLAGSFASLYYVIKHH